MSFAIILLTHGEIAFALKSAVEKIAGTQKDIYPFTNNVDSLPTLYKKIDSQICSLKKENYYLFVDLVGGSCWNLANMLAKDNQKLTVIGGVNLPMILSFIINYDSLSHQELVEKIVDDSKKSIQVLKGIN